ncbi:MAG: glycosyltransferase [Candidatus Hodarchaeales archaeon]
MIHFRVGELDGVSLEMDKWRKILEERYGHKVIYIAGTLGKSTGFSIPELSLTYPPSVKIKEKAFSNILDETEEEIIEVEIRSIIDQIKPQLDRIINENDINCVIPNNMLCNPLNIPASLALAEVIREKNIYAINHNHDFFWERTVFEPSCNLIKEYLVKFFPPNLPNYRQVVINSLAKKELMKKTGIDSIVVPNVFYFEEPLWKKDSYNNSIRSTLDIQENDIIILQATRIVKRKGIELIIDLISLLNQKDFKNRLLERPLFDGRQFNEDDKIILVMPNLIEDFEYKAKLEIKCKEMNVDFRFCNQNFAHQRSETTDTKIYSLWDAYTQADLVSYPSLQEGWGNQFLEAVKAKLPIILFEYDVYQDDIGPLGFDTLSLGSKYEKDKDHELVTISPNKLKETAKKIIEILQNSNIREKMVENNYKIGLENLSLTALGNYIQPLLPSP